MVDTTKIEPKRDRDIYYYRKRLKNRIFARLSAFFAEEAERTGITQKDIAVRLKKDPAQISRWLSGPSNLTLETLSDLLLALDAEADPPRFVRFKDRPKPNYVHPLITGAPKETSLKPPSETSGRAAVKGEEGFVTAGYGDQISVTTSQTPRLEAG